MPKVVSMQKRKVRRARNRDVKGRCFTGDVIDKVGKIGTRTRLRDPNLHISRQGRHVFLVLLGHEAPQS